MDVSSLVPAEFRAMVASFMAPGEPAVEVAHVEDRVIANEVPVRIYRPGGDGPFGCLLFLHGSGWVIMSVDTHDHEARALCNRGNVVVVSVDYRLAPEHKFPAAVDDCWGALEWVVASAAELGIDPGRIAVGGDSAGGNLSAVVSQLAEPKPALAILIYPVCDLSEKRDSYRLFGEGFFLTERNMDWYRANYLPDDEAGRDPRASPLLAADVSGLPRTHLAVAGFDPLRDEGLAYGARLRDAGVDVRVALHEGAIHGFANTVGVGRTSAAAMRDAAEALKTL